MLELFLASGAALIAALPMMSHQQQDETAHRLRGSCRGIGALAMAEAAWVLDGACPDGRDAAAAALAQAFADVDGAIRRRLLLIASLR